MIHLILDLSTDKEFHPIIEEGLQRLFHPTHVSQLTGPSTGNLSNFIREVLVTDRPESFVYDVTTYYVRADLLSSPVLVDDLVCKKLTGMDLPTWRAYQVTLADKNIPQRKKRTSAKKMRVSAYCPGYTTPKVVGDIRYTEVSQSNLLQVVQEIRDCDFYSLDMETNALDPRSGNVCMTISLAEGQAYYIPSDLIARVLLYVDWRRVTGQNLKYDLQCVDEYPETIGDDTLLIASLQEVPLGRRSLSALVLSEFGYKMVEFNDVVPKGGSIADIDHAQRLFYSCEDADWSRRLALRTKPRLTADSLSVYDIQKHLTPIIAEMEHNGLLADKKALRRLRWTQLRALVSIRRWIYKLAGHKFDLNSPQQVGKVLYDELGISMRRFAKRQPSTDVIALEEMSHPIAKAMLAYRELHKLKSTYSGPLLEKAHPQTGRVHPQFNQAIAASGRLSCKDPNAQNIPKTPTYREVVIAHGDNSLLKIDFDQLELRVLAGRSGGSTMRQVFESGANIHAHTASIIHGVPASQIAKDSSQYMDGKRGNFAIIFGAMERKVMEMFNCSYNEAQSIIQQLEAAYPDEMDYIQSEREKIRTERRAVTLHGRVRTFGDFVPLDVIEREGFNHNIQGSAVELVFIAMIDTMPTIRRYPAAGLPRAGLTNQVHDEVLIECLTRRIHDLRDELVPIMEAVKFSVPLKVTTKIGKKWTI